VGLYEVDKTSASVVTRTVTYYPAGGAMRINIVGGSNTVYYILIDQLGSASVVTDSTGVTVGEQRYYPYGETRITTGTIFTDKLFTGQRDPLCPTDISPKSTMESKNNHSRFSLCIWGRTHRKSGRRVVRGGVGGQPQD